MTDHTALRFRVSGWREIRQSFPLNTYDEKIFTVNSSTPNAAYTRRGNGLSLVQVMALSPVRLQAITWTNAGLLSIGLFGTNFSEIRIGILPFLFKKINSDMSSAKMSGGVNKMAQLSAYTQLFQTLFVPENHSHSSYMYMNERAGRKSNRHIIHQYQVTVLRISFRFPTTLIRHRALWKLVLTKHWQWC